MIKMWPKKTDILMNWDDDDLAWLQDKTLTAEAQKQYDQVMKTWNKLYKCLTKYPDLFKAESIGFTKFKWVYILTMNRCFASNWPSVSQMVPFADQLNHENVNVYYDCHDQVTGESCVSQEERRAREAKELAAKKEERAKYLENLSTDLAAIADDLEVTQQEAQDSAQQNNNQIKDEDKDPKQIDSSTGPKADALDIYKGIDENNTWRIKTKSYLGKLQQDEIDGRCEDIKSILAERQKRLDRIRNAQDELSSGLESDNDLDLLVEQEVLRAIKLRK